MKPLVETPSLEAAVLGAMSVVACVVAGALAVLDGRHEMFSGTKHAWPVFKSFALPLDITAGSMHWPSLAATWLLLHMHWKGKFSYARAVFVVALCGGVLVRMLRGRGAFEVFVCADALAGYATLMVVQSIERRSRTNA